MSEGPRWSRGRRGRRIAARLLRRLRRLRDRGLRGGSLGEDEFAEVYFDLDEFYEVTADEGRHLGVRCAKGCSNCCHQMVYGVHSFEVERIGRALALEGRAASIRDALIRRERAFAEAAPRQRGSLDDDSRAEVQALNFFALGHPCVFLDRSGACAIHDLRPYSCRRFFSLSDPELCTAAGVESEEYRGLFFEPSPHVDRAMTEVDAVMDFDARSERLDQALLRWLERHRSSSG